MITTIQLTEDTKNSLHRLKQRGETYEEAILRIITLSEQNRRTQEELLIEGCSEMAREGLKIDGDFANIDSELDWEW